MILNWLPFSMRKNIIIGSVRMITNAKHANIANIYRQQFLRLDRRSSFSSGDDGGDGVEKTKSSTGCTLAELVTWYEPVR